MALHTERLLEAWDAFSAQGLLIAQSEDLWDWRAEPGNVMPIEEDHREAASVLLARLPFLKLMRVFPFDDPIVSEQGVLDEAVAFFTLLKPLFAAKDT
jgi:hypothetical protein